MKQHSEKIWKGDYDRFKDLNNLSSSDYIESKWYELLDKIRVTDWTKEAVVRVVETIA